jgi:hypothetical protein
MIKEVHGELTQQAVCILDALTDWWKRDEVQKNASHFWIVLIAHKGLQES